ncbi:acyltransferase domain-containing protein [Streptomyces sp. MH13]|uniref:acyltransferase domain-containing protein n=1 Tax=unclassified Streptomyces TaxID=2593676 RepID=UPI003CF8980E
MSAVTERESAGPPVVVLLPGQGSQYPGMLRGLYGTEPVFTRVLDEVFGRLGEEGARVRADWLGDSPAVPLDDVRRAQPLLFGLDVALGTLLASWGVRPAAYLGHSAGEYAAAVLAGIMSLDDAVDVLAARVESLAGAPPGGMVAVAASAAQVAGRLTPRVVVAAVNAPTQVMLAGPDPDLGEVTARLTEDGTPWMPAKATTGFHSPSVADACAATVPAYRRISLRPPHTPLVSGYTGRELGEPLVRDPRFWAMQPSRPVHFGAALGHLLGTGGPLGPGPFLLVEAGPGQGLSAIARRHPAVTRGGAAVVPLSAARAGAERDRAQLAEAARRLLPAAAPARVPAVPRAGAGHAAS